MNLTETTMVLGVLQAAYPAFYRDFSRDELRNVANLWMQMFLDDDFRSVMVATQALIATKVDGIPPTIGAVKEQLRKIFKKEEMSELDAWSLVSKACANGYYHSIEEFEKLPEVVQRAVGGPEQLKAWSMMEPDTVESVVASNFMRTFRAKRIQQKELDMLPSEVKKYMSDVAEKMKLDGKNPETKSLKESGIKQIEAPTIEKLTMPDAKNAIPQIEFEQARTYTPPSEDEWEKMREKAMGAFEG